MDPAFWQERWRNRDIGFHLPDTHDLLQKHWPRLGLDAGSAVLVPLCGKSLDMVWLAEQGHRVIGAEVSDIAVGEFFAERGLAPEARAVDRFTVQSAGPYEIWCGDFFDLPPERTAGVAGVYDRAALIAFPAAMQAGYAQKLMALAPPTAPILLITLDYDQAQMAGPPFATSGEAVHRLFAPRRRVAELEARDVLARHPHFAARGLTALVECAYELHAG